jgi:hypothetical protein
MKVKATDMYTGYVYLRRKDDPVESEAPHQIENEHLLRSDAEAEACSLAQRLLKEYDF